MNRIKYIRALLVIMIMQIAFYVHAGEISLNLSERLQHVHEEEYLSVIVHMVDQTDLKIATQGILGRNKALRSRNVIKKLRSTAETRQGDLIAFLEKEKSLGNVSGYNTFWIFNGLSIEATPSIIKQVASRSDVERVKLDHQISLVDSMQAKPFQTDSPYPWNIEKINAPEVWEMGIDGSGVVVGVFDTGVDITHPDLADKYRGGDNSWFDPSGEHDQPVDLYQGFKDRFLKHGTRIAGVILGGNASGKHIGVAPGAQFIAAKIGTDAGEMGNVSDLHRAYQWFMDPDGDPETDDAADVINNSWAYFLHRIFLCEFDLREDFKALRAAGITPVFIAGNLGPFFFTNTNPGNYPETLAVGATNSFDGYALMSSRGPNTCDLSTFPDISAPGSSICMTIPGEDENCKRGTSMAAPHVTGVIALMLDANPDLTVDEIESILKTTAKPLGLFQPNNTFGWGRVDALAAVNAALALE